jgi:hypothetical protein
MKNSKAIKIDEANKIDIDANLQVFDVIIGPERLRSAATIQQWANDAEAQLTEQIVGLAPPEGAQFRYLGEESIPTNNPHARRATEIVLERAADGWYLVSVKAVVAYRRNLPGALLRLSTAQLLAQTRHTLKLMSALKPKRSKQTVPAGLAEALEAPGFASLLRLLLSDSRRLRDLGVETRPKWIAEFGSHIVEELRQLISNCPEPHLARLALGCQTLAMKIRPDDLAFDVVFIKDEDDEMSDYRRAVWDEDFLLPDLPKLDCVDDVDQAFAFVHEMMECAGLSELQSQRLSELIGDPSYACMLEMLMHNPFVTAVVRARVLETFERDYFPLLGDIPEFTYSCLQDRLEAKALERERHAARKLRQQYKKP